MTIDTELQRTINALEIQRKVVSDLKIKSYIFIGLGVLISALGFLLFSSFFYFFLIPGLAAFIYGIVRANKGSQLLGEYRHQFKNDVIGSAMKTIDPSLEIDYRMGLSEGNFISSNLFSTEPDRYSSEDQILGVAGKTRFGFSEVHAEYKTETQTKNGRKVEWHDIFKGIIFCADFNKHFHGATIIKPKDLGSSIGSWFSENLPIFSSGNNVVKLENPAFSKCFVTYSTDQVEARYILTPSMMERLCELESKSKYTISVSFIDTYMYIAFPLDKNYFEPPVFKSLLDESTWQEDINIIRFMYTIVAELDLNTRIWGKD